MVKVLISEYGEWKLKDLKIDLSALTKESRFLNSEASFIYHAKKDGLVVEVSGDEVENVLEYEEVLKRQATDLGVDDRQIDDVIDYLCKNSNRRRVHYLWRPSLSDPDDDFLLELAVECESDYIVTYNSRDFLAADRFQIRTVTPREFLKVIGEIE